MLLRPPIIQWVRHKLRTAGYQAYFSDWDYGHFHDAELFVSHHSHSVTISLSILSILKLPLANWTSKCAVESKYLLFFKYFDSKFEFWFLISIQIFSSDLARFCDIKEIYLLSSMSLSPSFIYGYAQAPCSYESICKIGGIKMVWAKQKGKISTKGKIQQCSNTAISLSNNTLCYKYTLVNFSPDQQKGQKGQKRKKWQKGWDSQMFQLC